MNDTEKLLWRKISSFKLDDPDVTLTFTDRLARENAWSIDFSVRAIEEYKRFMFLLCITRQPLTPSEQVDQVWHQHLLYTESYWDGFCGNVLNMKIHHHPTKGGQEEKYKYQNLYQETLDTYFRVFRERAPLDIWPDVETRFRNTRYQWINKDEHWIIPKNIFKNK